jgi:hypothetical protein
MNASIVVAICATVIAVLSLAVSVYEARAARRHDRISVRPHLALQASLRQGSRAGLQLINAGLGPAAITRTVLTLDGEPLGEFSEASVNILRGKLSARPAAVTFTKTILATGYDQFLLSVEPFDRTGHASSQTLSDGTRHAAARDSAISDPLTSRLRWLCRIGKCPGRTSRHTPLKGPFRKRLALLLAPMRHKHIRKS